MTKSELEQKIEELQKQLDELKNVKIEKKQKKWNPALGEKYYYINAYGEINRYNFDNDEFDNDCANFGNCFKTKEEAQFVADKIKYTQMFKNYVEEHSDPLDWENGEQAKWYMYYSYSDYSIGYEPMYYWKTQGVIYASSKQILRDAVAYVGKDNVKKYVLGVEQ